MFKSLKNMNWSLYTALLLTGLCPTIYTTVRLFFLNELPSEQGLNIASQIQWLSIISEVLQEGMIFPMFFLFGQVLRSNPESFASRIKTGLVMTFGVYLTLSLIIIINVRSLVYYMGNKEFINETISYIRLESVAFIFITLNQVVAIVLNYLKKEKYIYTLLITQITLIMFFDTFLLSSLPFSLQIGVQGIAWSNIISGGIVFIVGLLLINRSIPLLSAPLTFDWTKNWLKIGFMSGLESLVRNLAYVFMIVYMMNQLSQQGLYWQTTSFIWIWLLLPILKLGELIKRDSGESTELFQKNYVMYLSLTTIIIVLWGLLSPFYQLFFSTILNVSNSQEIFSLLLLLLPGYVAFAYSQIWDSYFYGIGKTDYILYRSIFMNSVYYGTFYILYRQDIFVPSLESISYMFSGGLVVGSCITYLQFQFITRKKIKQGNDYVIS